MTELQWMIQIGYLILSGAFVCALYRFVKGPSLPDRIVSLDLVAMTIAGLTTVYAVENSLPVLLDIVLVLAIVLFLSTVAFGRYLSKQEKSGRR